MKNLFERLNEKNIKELESYRHSFPCHIENLFDELQKESFYICLTYDTICNLVTFLQLPNHSPSSIYKIFNHE